MRVQLPFLFFLSLSLTGNAQQMGFSHFSSQTNVHQNDDGKTFIYSIGEPLNTYDQGNEACILQGLLHSDRQARDEDQKVIQIRVFIDENEDGIKNNDEKFTGIGKVQVVGQELYQILNQTGIVYFAPLGTYTFEYFNLDENYRYTTSQTQVITIDEDSNYLTINFGITKIDIMAGAEIYLMSSRFRCFRKIPYSLCFRNTGTERLENTIYLQIDERLDSIYYYEEPDIYINDHLVGWHFSLDPGVNRVIKYELNAPEVNSPDDIGVVYKTRAWIDLDTYQRKELCYEQELRCSYDPNDKLVQPDRPDSLALLDQELVYTIRFQNTGNDVADDVVVADTLDTDLDLGTFTVINTSHPRHLEVVFDSEKPNIVNFRFPNIFLPDSTTNEPASNGNVTYSIMPKEGLPLNTEITNTAYIYFDFNPAIITNTTSSTLVDTFPIPKEDIITEYTRVICKGESYDGYTVSGQYTDVFPQPSGYDSIRLLTLITLEQEEEYISHEICEGESYMGYNKTGLYHDTLPGMGCGKILSLDLVMHENSVSHEEKEICRNETYQGYMGSGIIVEQHKNVHGCDSIHTIELITAFVYISESREICHGDSYQGYDETDIYEDIIYSSDGCDSLRVLELTILEENHVELEIEICPNQNYEGYTTTGSYEDIFQSSNGCDSIRQLNLNVIDEVSEEIKIEICKGEVYEGYDATGIYEDMYINSEGCDSVRILNLSVLPETQHTQEIEICSGETYENYSKEGTYEDVFVGSNGCDSIRVLVLSVLESFFEIQEVEICEGEEHDGHDKTGIYENLFTTQYGCDSTVTTHLDVNQNTESHEEVHICRGENYKGYEEEGLYSEVYANAKGCDSIRHIRIVKIDRHDPICAFRYDNEPKYFDSTSYLDIYPNPTSDEVRLIIDSPEKIPAELEVLTLHRKRILLQRITEENTTIDVSDYSSGVYIFILRIGHNVYVKRLFKS